VRIATIKNIINNKCWRGCGEKEALIHCWWECKVAQPLWKIVWRLLKNLEIGLSYDPAIPLLGIYLKEGESGLFSFVKPRCTTNELIKKMWYLYKTEFYSPQRKMKFCHSQVNGWNWRTSS
jgi:hypothetical protein